MQCARSADRFHGQELSSLQQLPEGFDAVLHFLVCQSGQLILCVELEVFQALSSPSSARQDKNYTFQPARLMTCPT